MDSYSVKQVAELLDTNPETVRRWIRSGKLIAHQDSRKGGNVIGEDALCNFIKATPKYATATMALLFGPAAVSAAVIGGIVIHDVISHEQNKLKVSSEEIIKMLSAEIETRKASIEKKRESIEKLEAQIIDEQKKIEKLQSTIDGISRISTILPSKNEVQEQKIN